MSQRDDFKSPTLPLPPPRSEASRVTLEDLIEAATRAAQRGAPGGEGGLQPYHPPIWVGIVIHPPSPFAIQTAAAAEDAVDR
jgi:hypothetical protein